MIFGLEWQHRFDVRDEDALLLQVRLPLGTWWFLDRKRKEQDERRRGNATAPRSSRAAFVSHEPQPQAPVASAQPVMPAPAEAPPRGLLRVEIAGDATGLIAEIDGQPAPTALFGYDVSLSPGDHELVLRRGELPVARERFNVAEGQLVRLTPVIAAP